MVYGGDFRRWYMVEIFVDGMGWHACDGVFYFF